MDMKLGLVLGGGGGRGAYQIGVWEALRELGIDKHIKVISGTSIGALNAMLFMQGDLELAKKAWINLQQEEVLPLNKKNIIMQGKIRIFNTVARINKILDLKPDLLYEGEFSRQGILNVMDEFLDIKKALESSIPCYCTCSDIVLKDKIYFKVQDYPEDIIKDILLASSAIPGIYDAVEINGRLYLDGGLKDNVPILPVYNEGCDIIIVVRLCPEDTIDYSRFPGVQMIDITLQEDKDIAQDGLFDFSHETVRQKMAAGYSGTMNLIMPIVTVMNNVVTAEKEGLYIGKIKSLLAKFRK